MDINSLIRLALQYYHSGKLELAQASCQEILKKEPNNANILYLLGIIYFQLNNHDSALYHIKRSLRLQRNNADAYVALGTILRQKGTIDDAESAFKKALELNPGIVDAYYHLADIFRGKNQIEEAMRCYKKALELNPGNAQSYYNLGFLQHAKGHFDDAISSFEKAAELNPANLDAYNELGNVFLEKKEFEKAIGCYQHAVRISPDNPTAYINLGIAFSNMGKLGDAIECFQKALSLNPNLEEVYHLIGLVLIRIGKFAEALESYRILLQINPDSVKALTNLGFILSKQGKNDEAIACYQHALRIQPHDLVAHEALLMTMHYSPRYDAKTIFSAHKRFADQCLAPLSLTFPSYVNKCVPNRKLNIGYVSSDFKHSSVAFFIEPVLASHHRQQFEVFCYSSVEEPDETTKRITKLLDNYRDISKLSYKQATELIRQDAIDILIDLSGYTFNNRLQIFTQKPSPVQVSWIGYPDTTGLGMMDYKIVDNHTDPPGMTEQFYTEKLIRLPDCFLCYLPFADSPECGSLPSLSKGSVTFGSFNNFSKISPDNFSLWSEILKRTPNSRFVLKAGALADRKTCEYALDMFEKNGIDGERIELFSWLSSTEEHLALYNHVDIALDTFPYNGTTTTCEALWMGVPVIALAGKTHVSRVGASLLSNVGLPELIASTTEDYIETAVNLAHNMSKLQYLRENLRELMSRSPLTDIKRFIINLEDCYRSIWKQWCTSANQSGGNIFV